MEEKKLIHQLIQLAFAEDIGEGDHTTLCSIPEDALGASLVDKSRVWPVRLQRGILSFDPNLMWRFL